MAEHQTMLRYRVRSLDRALALLEQLAEAGPEGVTVSEAARAAGLSKSAGYAILQTLLARGYVADSGRGPSRRYRLGMTLARLGDLVVSRIGLRDVAMPVLEQLTAETGLTSRLAVLDGPYAVVIGRVDAPTSIRFAAHLGKRELLHCTAVGKALLAALPEARAREVVAEAGLERRTPHTITDVGSLVRDLAAAAERGYAVDDEEDTEGVFCVGAAVFDHTGSPAGAISVTGLKLDLPVWRIHRLGETVRDRAAQISELLGAPGRDVTG